MTDLVIDASEALARTFAERFAAEARAATLARGRFSCALPGGSVAETFLPALRRVSVDWSAVDFFWGDERAVPPGDSESNYGLAKRLLLDAIDVDPRRVHRMAGEAADLDAAARAYEEEMVRVLGDPPRIDWVVLGVGPDGHVCSLFPGHPLLRERARRVAVIRDAPKPPPRRLTFTLPVLAQARTLCVAGFGATKADAIRAAVEDAAAQLPVALALRAGERSLVLVDPAAAGRLHRAAISAPR